MNYVYFFRCIRTKVYGTKGKAPKLSSMQKLHEGQKIDHLWNKRHGNKAMVYAKTHGQKS